ncbi:hypothetical protein [Streptomyces sp. AC495_CC817]|uniref:hypothetical protein n=1 Tax=Streptomyces sp. AC495_CC817 TaxID=2823900 RepID=UPI001C276090|nr:hypothetical protein [Streptomyces sp. AC495_CC817]
MNRTRAQSAAGFALLHHVNPRGGGSCSNRIDAARAEKVAQNITGPELLALLIDAAERGGEDARRESSFQRARIVDEVRRLAEITDSLALHRFIEKEAAR